MSWDNFDITCKECGKEATLEILDIFDGDALVAIKCEDCKIVESKQFDIKLK